MPDLEDPYGPYQIHNNNVFIKFKYVPMPLGTCELRDLIQKKKVDLCNELGKWLRLECMNEDVIEERNDHERFMQGL